MEDSNTFQTFQRTGFQSKSFEGIDMKGYFLQFFRSEPRRQWKFLPSLGVAREQLLHNALCTHFWGTLIFLCTPKLTLLSGYVKVQDRLQKNLGKLLYMVSRDTIISVCLVYYLTGLFLLSEERSNQPLCLLRPWFPSLLIMLTRVPIIVNHHSIFANMNTNSSDSFLIWSRVFVILDRIQVCISDW